MGQTKYGKEVILREYEEWLKEYSKSEAIPESAEKVRNKIYHPELAGSRIEYAWGLAEINFKIKAGQVEKTRRSQRPIIDIERKYLYHG